MFLKGVDGAKERHYSENKTDTISFGCLPDVTSTPGLLRYGWRNIPHTNVGLSTFLTPRPARHASRAGYGNV